MPLRFVVPEQAGVVTPRTATLHEAPNYCCLESTPGRRQEMSDNLLSTLRVLEEEYAGQPLVAQQADLREINRIRAQFGMPLVDARLKVIGVTVEGAKPEPKPRNVPDHTEAREIYQAYRKKSAELAVH